MRGATITTSTCVVEVCDPNGSCKSETSATVTLAFEENETWAALCVAAREAGVTAGILMETFVRTGLSLAGYNVGSDIVTAVA